MANNKDFKVKKGLVVTENILAQGNIQLVDSLGNTLTLVDSSNNVIVAGSIIGPSTLTIDPAAVGDATGLVRILGNLTVEGTTTSINSTTLDVSDKNITIAKNAADAAAANGAGLTIDGASATLTYASTGDKFVFNKSVEASSFVGSVTGNIVGNVTGNVTGTVSDISNHSTSNLSEGTNLYYTTTRSDSDFDASFALASTDSLSEGSTNLYHTTARVRSSISGDKGISYNNSTGVIDVDSTNITSIARGAVSASGALTYNVANGQFSFVSGQSGLIDSSLAQGMIDSNFNNIDSLNVTGIITAGTVNAGTINATNITGDGSNITGAGADSGQVQSMIDSNLTNGRNVTLGNIAGTLTTAAQANITSVGTLGSLSVSGTSSLGGLSTIGGTQITGNITPTTGTGVEIFAPNSSTGQVQAFNRGGAAFNKLIIKGDPVEIYDGSTKTIETTSTGINVTGNIVVSGTVDGRDVATDGTKLDGIASSATANPNAIDNIVEDTSPQLGGDLASNGNNIQIADGDLLRVGTGNDLEIYHQSNVSYLKSTNTAAPIRLQAPAGEIMGDFIPNAGVELYHNGTKKFETTSAGVTVTGDLDLSGNVDGRDIATDGTKLDGIDASATANPITGAQADRIITSGGGKALTAQTDFQFDGTNLFVPAEIRHLGDPDTKLGFTTDTITITAGGATAQTITATSTTIAGNLIVNGTTTTLNSTTLDVDDLNITVAKGAGSAAAANGAGLTVDGASATLLYQSTGDKFVFNKPLEATSFTGNFTSSSVDINGGAIDGTNIGATTPGTGAFTTLTGNTVGGFSHLSAVGGGGTIDIVVTVASKTAAHRYNGTGSGSGYVLDGVQAPYLTLTPGRTYKFKQDDNSNSGHPFRFYYDAAKTTAYTTNVTTQGSGGSTGDYTQIVVDENTPPVLFYQCSAHGYMGNAVRMGTRNFTGLTSDNLTEGSTNLYYTNARVDTRFDTRLATKSTTNLTEGTNLYFTNARADARIQAANLSDLNNVTGVPSSGQFLKWNGSNWVPDTVSSGGGTVDSASTITLINSTVDSNYLANRVTASATFTPKPKYARLRLTSNQTLSSNASTVLTNFNTRVTDTSNSNALTSTLADGKFIIPAGVTKVKLSASVRTATPSDQVVMKILKNGSNLEGTSNLDVQSSGGDFPLAFSAIIDVAQNDYFQLSIFNGSGSPVAQADDDFTWFELEVVEGSMLTDFGNINLADLGNVATTAPSSGEVLKWNGSAWAPAADATGGGGGSQNLFSTIAVAGQSDVVADATTDTLTLVAGSNMTITTNAGSDTITFASTGGGGGSGGLDSALVTQLIDSAYVQLRQTSGGGSGTVDSAATISLINAHSLDSANATSLIDSDYVQARMLGINSSKITEFKYLADSGQTVFSGNDVNGNALAISSTNHEVYLNGIRLLNDDFTASPSVNSITVAQGLDSADELVIVTQGSLTTNDRFVIGAGTERFFFSADSGQTTFTGNDKHGNALAFDSGQVDVYLNGILLTNEDVIQNGTTNTITLTSAADSDDDLAIIAYNATLASEFTAGTGTLNTFKYTLNAAQTIITGADIRGNSLAYIPGNQQVFLNGLLLEDSDDYETTSTGSITLTSGANANDEIVIQDFASKFSGNTAGIINPEFKEFKYIADSGDTVFSGNDASGQALALTSNNFEVFLNGIRLLKSDYVANTTANRITLQGFTAADSDEIIINTIVGNVRFNSASSVASIVDSAYVNARVAAGTDSASVINLINSTVDEAYITRHSLDSSLALQLLLDSSEIIDLIDSAYINARVSTVDSAQVLGIVDSAYIQTAADSAHVQSKIPHAYIQARVPASYIQANQTNFLDSALTSQLVDSAYVAARTTAGTDSAAVIAMIDSDHINSRLGIFSVSPITTEFLYTVDSGATIISGNDNAGKSLVIDSNNFEVFLNGIRLQSTDYVDSAVDNRITLNNHLDSGDEISVVTTTQQNTLTGVGVLPGIVDSAYIQARLSDIVPASTSFSTFRYVSTEGQTVYTGNDANGAALSYDSVGVQVFLNGLLLTKTQDFTLQNKNQITLQDSVNAGSELIINNHNTSFRGQQFTSVAAIVDSVYVAARQLPATTYNATSSNITLVKGNAYIVDTSSARTLTLPASAVLGDEIKVIDGTGQANTNNITINRNGHKIQGLTDNLVINVNRAAQGLVYYNAAQGWILSEN